MNSPNGKRICFIYKEDYPWDVRVEKVILALSNQGYKVDLLCRNNKGLPRVEQTERFTIHRLPALSGFLRHLSAPFYFNPFWFLWILGHLRRTRPDLVIVRDLPLTPMTLSAARVTKCRTILDMAECYPEMYASTLEYSDRKFVKRIVKNPGFARLMERYSVRNADLTFVMIEESRDRLIAMGMDPARIILVSNTPPAKETPFSTLRKIDGELRLLYVGFVTRIRGLENVLRGMRAYLDRNPDGPEIRFDVVGIGAAQKSYATLTAVLGLEQQVHFHGWSEQEFIDDLYASSHIGVLSYHVCSHWNHTIPNKLFDYMQMGLPVLATEVTPIKRIIEETGCGVVVADRDPESFARGIGRLIDFEDRQKMGQRGVKSVAEKYHWDKDRDRMLEAILSLGNPPDKGV